MALEAWPDIVPRFSGSALLCGNGLGINVWPAFAYGSLFDHARSGGLTDEDLALFGGAENFERVLSDLNTAIRVNEALGMRADRVYERYRSIQRALGHAIREVHLNRTRVPESNSREHQERVAHYESIFNTSYDLLLYWAMGCGGDFSLSFTTFAGADGLSSTPNARMYTQGRSRCISSTELCT